MRSGSQFPKSILVIRKKQVGNITNMGSRTESESEREIWKAMEVAEGARGDNSSSHVLQSSSLTLDTSLSLPDLTPPLMFVSFTSFFLK